MVSRIRPAVLIALLLPAAGCPEPIEPPVWEQRATQVVWDPEGGDFWDLPLPSDLRAEADGSWDLENWPGTDIDIAEMWLEALDRRVQGGWGLSSGVSFVLSGALDPSSLPADGANTIEGQPGVFLIDIDPDSPERGRMLPLRPRFDAPELPYAPGNRLTAIPVWGHLRRPETTYALVLTDALLDEGGAPLGRSEAFHQHFEPDFAASGLYPDLETEALEGFGWLRATLEAEGLSADSVVGASVFSTMNPHESLDRLADWTERQPMPALAEPWVEAERYESYVVLNARFTVPVIQGGERPYSDNGEGWIIWREDGDPEIQETQDVRLALTLPLGPMPAAGWPLMMYLHGSGGEWYQAINRGPVNEVTGQGPDGPGQGPSEWLARRGVATLGFDFPIHGDRSNPPDTSGLLKYNLLGNIEATLDNFQVSVMELLLLSRFMLDQEIDPAVSGELDQGATVFFDEDRLTAMGQSMGTTLGVPWAGYDPRLDGVVLSGAGGILVEIATSAIEPFPIQPILAAQLGVDPALLNDADPLLHAFQNLWDLVDPIAKAPFVVAEPRPGVPPKQVLMTAGVRDGYFHPRSESAMATALGVPLAGAEVEPILPDSLELAGIAPVSYPVSQNLDGTTAAVIQYDAPNNLGHYVVFNQEGARYQYTCFVASVGTAGGAVIPAEAGLDDPCP